VLGVVNASIYASLFETSWNNIAEISDLQAEYFINVLEVDSKGKEFVPEDVKTDFLNFYDGGTSVIIDKTGEIILDRRGTNKGNIYNDLANAVFPSGGSLKTVKSDMNLGRTNKFRVTVDGEPLCLYYKSLDVNDWRIVTFAPDEVVTTSAELLISSIATTGVLMLISSTVVAFIFLRSDKKHTSKMNDLIYIDELTGGSTLTKFKEDASEKLKGEEKWAFVIVDIDKMKLYNATFSFKEGDVMLKRIARVLREKSRENELSCRAYADIFYFLAEFENEEILSERLHDIYEAIIDDFRKQHFKSEYNVSFSASVYEIPDNNEELDSIFDKARYVRQNNVEETFNTVSFYTDSIREKLSSEKDVENRMKTALDNNEFRIYLQPKYSLADEKIAGAEALVRWVNKAENVTKPDSFIPVFEKNGFITKLDFKNFKLTCQILKKWQKMGCKLIPVSVNFSRLHLYSESFVDEISAIADQNDVPRHLLEIEITESAVFDDDELLVEALGKLHNAGFPISIDDFGTGYSSLNMLKDIPVDVLKLDKGFFTTTPENEKKSKIVISTVINLAKKLGIKTVAEGVETQEFVNFLRELGCDMVQGYFYSKPMPEGEFHELLEKIPDTEEIEKAE
jgi:diguanylate cyclase (GGDEF)-like protein